jgi:hypothetical protein
LRRDRIELARPLERSGSLGVIPGPQLGASAIVGPERMFRVRGNCGLGFRDRRLVTPGRAQRDRVPVRVLGVQPRGGRELCGCLVEMPELIEDKAERLVA